MLKQRDERERSGVGGLGKRRVNSRTTKEHLGTQQLTSRELSEVHEIQREVTGIKGLSFCGITAIPGREVQIVKTEASRARFRGVVSCKSKFCVRCQKKQRKEKTDDLDKALWAVEKAGGTIMLGVLTCSNMGLKLRKQLDLLHKVWDLLFKRRPLKRKLEELGYIGFGRGDDVMLTVETRKHHAHVHYALAFKGSVSEEDEEELKQLVISLWCEIMGKRGVLALEDQQRLERAKERKETDGAQFKYIAKGVALEVTNGLVKVGKRGSVTFFGLLVLIWRMKKEGLCSEMEIEELIALYKDMEKELERCRLVSISKELKKYAEDSAQEAEEVEEVEDIEEVEILVTVPANVFVAMRRLKVIWVTPSLCIDNEEFLMRLREVCARERARESIRGYEGGGVSEELLGEVRDLYRGLAGQGIFKVLRCLGLRPRLREQLYGEG